MSPAASAPGAGPGVTPLQGLPVRLAPDQLAVLADLVAARVLAAAPSLATTPVAAGRQLVTADTVARAIGMTANWVREHGAELGGQRLGDGPRPRWRFDLDVALSAWASRSTGERSPTPQTLQPRGSRRRRGATSGSAVELLPVRDQGGRRAA